MDEDPSPSAVDRGVLDDLETALGDDPETIRDVVGSFLEDAPRLIAAIREAIGSGDVERTSGAAHTLEANSASIGALGLSAMARELATLTWPETTEPDDLGAPEIAALVAVMEYELEHVRAELEGLIPPDDD